MPKIEYGDYALQNGYGIDETRYYTLNSAQRAVILYCMRGEPTISENHVRFPLKYSYVTIQDDGGISFEIKPFVTTLEDIDNMCDEIRKTIAIIKESMEA